MSAVKELFFETLDERYRVLLASGVPTLAAYDIAFFYATQQYTAAFTPPHQSKDHHS